MPRLHTLHASIELPLPIDQVFPFFSTAENLERLTPPRMRFRVVSEKPVHIAAGTLIDYRLRMLGVPSGWRSRISVWEPPHRFVDEQVQGPYASWVHTHEFQDLGGATAVIDRVEFALPAYPLGELALPLVRAQLRGIFSYRQQAMSQALGVSGRHATLKEG
ncbi:MAG: SRPBCC family protein [Planctomycetota bacterium]